MNNIFNDNVPLETETPAFAKHVLPAVPSSEVYLEDCVKALKRFNDKHFDLAIVDPPYGIGFDGNTTANGGIAGRRNGFTHKQHHEKKGGITKDQQMNTLPSYKERLKIKSFGVEIILLIYFQRKKGGFFGIRKSQMQITQTFQLANLRGLHLIVY